MWNVFVFNTTTAQKRCLVHFFFNLPGLNIKYNLKFNRRVWTGTFICLLWLKYEQEMQILKLIAASVNICVQEGKSSPNYGMSITFKSVFFYISKLLWLCRYPVLLATKHYLLFFLSVRIHEVSENFVQKSWSIQKCCRSL